jgi:hypothetical protein
MKFAKAVSVLLQTAQAAKVANFCLQDPVLASVRPGTLLNSLRVLVKPHN